MNLAALIEEGICFHLAGDLRSAEATYRKVLGADPSYPDAHHLLGHVYNSNGDQTKALYHLNMAIAGSRHPQFLNTRGAMFMNMGRYREAVADLREAIKLSPDAGDVYANLCGAYRSLKELRKAREAGREAVRLRPDLGVGWINLGATLLDLGEKEEARRHYMKGLEIEPRNPTGHANLGKAHYQLLDFEDACRSFEAARQLGFEELEFRFVYVHSLLNLGRTGEAAGILEEGFQRNSDLQGLRGLLGQDVFFQVLFKVCVHFARVVGAPERAVALYERCLQSYPDSAALWVNLGTVYFDWHRYPDAIRCNQEALKRVPELVWAHNNIGVSHVALGQRSQGIESFEKAVAIQPDFTTALGWLVREKSEICDWKDFAGLRERLRSRRFSGNAAAISPFVALSLFDDPADLHYWARLASEELFATVASAEPLVPGRRKKRKKIRIGYYSFDFRDHPVAHLTARLFELHDKALFDVYAYSYGPDDGSSVRRRIEKAAKSFVEVRELSVVDTAKRIAADDLDILIDLTGNTLHTRSQVMALRPCRVQAHWLGFIGTMGSPHYDYILADDFVVPPGDEGDFSEKILRLPGGMHVMDETRVIDGRGQTRSGNGLPEDAVVFGCFCQSFKIQPEVFARWMDVLCRVPGSVLWLASGPAGMEDNLKREAAAHGVAPERLVIARRCGMDEYLSRFALMDLYLDTFPYTSGTVASDALLGGCPVLTLAGRTMVSRMAGSILRHADLSDLVCDSGDAYVTKACELGNSPAQRAALKASMARARSTAGLFDTPAAVRGLEQVLRAVLK